MTALWPPPSAPRPQPASPRPRPRSRLPRRLSRAACTCAAVVAVAVPIALVAPVGQDGTRVRPADHDLTRMAGSAATTNAVSGQVHAAVRPSAPARGSRWTWPLDRLEVVRPFDPPLVRWGSGHRGVDLRAATEAPVRAVGAGVVVFAGELAGRGVVSVQHGALRTTYEPVAATVAAGDRVNPGEVIGTLAAAPGSGHCPSDACLHLGLRSGTAYLDPMLLFRPVRVRLLPSRRAAMGPSTPKGEDPTRSAGGPRGDL